MPSTFEQSATVSKEGHFPMWLRQQIVQFLKINAGKQCKLKLSVGGAVSDPQRGYYWKVIIPSYKDFMGYDDSLECHEDLMSFVGDRMPHLQGERINKLTGELVTVRPSISKDKPNKMTKNQMVEVMEFLFRFAIEKHHRKIPSPEEYWENQPGAKRAA